ncbi:hypothetical protein Tco_0846392 [Tanacetum coccineum]
MGSNTMINPDNIDKNDPKDVQLEDEDIMYDIALSVEDIDKRLFQRRLMGNLEKFVGGREYGEDLRLLTRTI